MCCSIICINPREQKPLKFTRRTRRSTCSRTINCVAKNEKNTSCSMRISYTTRLGFPFFSALSRKGNTIHLLQAQIDEIQHHNWHGWAMLYLRVHLKSENREKWKALLSATFQKLHQKMNEKLRHFHGSQGFRGFRGFRFLEIPLMLCLSWFRRFPNGLLKA